MKARALVLGIVTSVVLLGVAGLLYVLAGGGAQGEYRAAVSLTRQIQHLSSQWSVEIARVKSDPLADFDALSGFIPRMAQLKHELSGTVREIAGLPDRLASDVNAYLSALEAQEERIERFKTGHAVVRNSTRYLPLAAANVTRQAQEAGEEALEHGITVLVQDMNQFLASPTETARGRLAEELERLRGASVVHPPALANGLANFVAHAEVLLDRQGPSEELFQRATSSEIAEFTERLVGSFEFELGEQVRQSAWYERGMLGVITLLALFWVGLTLQQRGAPAPLAGSAAAPLTAGARTDASAEPLAALEGAASESGEEDEEDLRAAVLAAEGDRDGLEAEDLRAAVLAAEGDMDGLEAEDLDMGLESVLSPEESTMSVEGALRHGFLARCAADSLAASARRIATRMDYLHQTQSRIQQALHDHDALLPALEDGADLDEEIEAAGAIVAGVRRETNTIADLARSLAATSAAQPNGALHRDMVDLNACVEDVLRATGAEAAATIDRRLGAIPDIFASRAEIRLLLTQIIDNALHAVTGLQGRTGAIKVDTARRNDDILITVIDNGRGISAERRAKIFRPFYTSRDGALGLGLTLASHLAAKYEGDVKVNSLPDQGTVTRITLPAGLPNL